MLSSSAGSDPFRLTVHHPSLSIILTPPLQSDGVAVLKALNDPRVYMNLDGPPFPYTTADWESWYAITKDSAESCQEEWDQMTQTRFQDGDGSQDKHPGAHINTEKWIGRKQWVSAIRTVMSPVPSSEHPATAVDSTESFIGEITIRRSGFPNVLDRDERHKTVEVNTKLPAGDPGIVWEVGFYLTPAYHGHGVMPLALRTLMHEVLVPYLNVRTLTATYFEHNLASRRVFEKCGFQLEAFLPAAVQLAEAKLAQENEKPDMVGFGVMRWEKSNDLKLKQSYENTAEVREQEQD